MVPWTEANRPFTLEIMRWRTPNPATVWAGSMVQVVVAARSPVSVVVVMARSSLGADMLGEVDI
jgi:hypothetical protein